MSAAAPLLQRLVLRPLWRDPVRTGLVMIAVALGVAVVIAIDLAGDAAASSFTSSLGSLVGKQDLLITATGGVDERLLGPLVTLPEAFQFTPRIEDYAFVDGRGEATPFLGVDLVAWANTHPSGLDTTAAYDNDRDPVWVTRSLGLRQGQQISLLINASSHQFTVAGVLPAMGSTGRDQRLMITDIGVAQRVTGKIGRLDSIDVALPKGGTFVHWRKQLRSVLPPGVELEPQGARTDQNRKMLAAFRWNLHVLSYIAILVAGFLIYNAVSISVVRRRTEIGVLRAIGATRSEILAAVLAEGSLFATVGCVLGLVAGRLLASGAVALVGNTVQALYVTSQAAPVHLTWVSAIESVAIGFGVSLLAAFAPAVEASRVAPVEAMARGRHEYVNLRRSRRGVVWAVGALAAAGLLTQAPPVHRQPVFAYTAVLLLVGGTSLLIPNLVSGFSRLFHRAVQGLLGVEAALALQSLRTSIGRTSVLTAALVTAIAMTAAISIMVGSFRETVALWMSNELRADFYLRPAGTAAADRHPTMSAAIADEIEKIPGVAAVDRFRAYPITYDGAPATLGGGEVSKVERWSSTRLLPGENARAIFAKMPTGDYAIVSEPFANKHDVRPGSDVALTLGAQRRSFRVLGIYYDYSTERGYVILDRHTLLRYLPDPAASNLAVYLTRGTNADVVRARIGAVLSGKAVLLFSNSTLRRGAIAIFDQTFRITYALEAVAILVAVLGVAGALLALVLDRRREFALLRFLGAARGQIRAIILFEAGLLGALSTGIGLLLGTLLSLVLIFVINKQSFGWTIQFHWPFALLGAMLSGIYAATVLAGLFPARLAVNLNPAEAIHEE